MTYPEYLRRECRVDGHRLRMRPTDTEFLALLLVASPHKVVEHATIIEALWPDPDTQALTANKLVSIVITRLRKAGVPIKNVWGRGYLIPAECRGGRAPADYRMAA